MKPQNEQTNRLNIVLTGGNNGIGFQTARALYNNGHHVIFGSRNLQKNQEAVETISKSGKGKIQSFPLDLSKRESIQQFVKSVKKQFPGHIDQLINNSGMIISQKTIGQLGVQMTITINHFGHFYLTYLLFDSIKKSKQGRIINLSSAMHAFTDQKSNFYQNLQYNNKKYSNVNAYGVSKLANVHFSQALAKRCQKKYPNIKSVSVHPGFVDSGFGKNQENNSSGMWKIFNCLKPVCCCCCMKNNENGAATTVYTSTLQFSKLRNGEYYSDSQWTEMDKKGRDEKQIQTLWSLSEKLYGVQFKI